MAALGQVQQHRRQGVVDLLQAHAADQIGGVFLVRQPARTLRRGAPQRQHIDRGPARALVFSRIGMNGNEHVRLVGPRLARTLRQRDEEIAVAHQVGLHARGRVDLSRQLARHGQGDVLLALAGRPDRARILATVASVDGNDQRAHAATHRHLRRGPVGRGHAGCSGFLRCGSGGRGRYAGGDGVLDRGRSGRFGPACSCSGHCGVGRGNNRRAGHLAVENGLRRKLRSRSSCRRFLRSLLHHGRGQGRGSLCGGPGAGRWWSRRRGSRRQNNSRSFRRRCRAVARPFQDQPRTGGRRLHARLQCHHR